MIRKLKNSENDILKYWKTTYYLPGVSEITDNGVNLYRIYIYTNVFFFLYIKVQCRSFSWYKCINTLPLPSLYLAVHCIVRQRVIYLLQKSMTINSKVSSLFIVNLSMDNSDEIIKTLPIVYYSSLFSPPFDDTNWLIN